MENSKRFLLIVLACALTFAPMSVAFASVPEDVKGTDYENAVERLSALEILKGYEDGTFRPDETITRAEMAVIVVRSLGLENAVVKGSTNFNDVSGNHWASGYINVAAGLGIVNGIGNGLYAPEAPVKYEEAITMIVRALGYEPAIVRGYPSGYITKAAELDITDDVNGILGTAARRGIVSQLLDNSLDVNMMERVSYGDEVKYEITDETFFGKIGAEEIEGVVDSVDLADKEIRIDGTDYDVADGLVIDGLEGAQVTIWEYDDKIVNIQLDSEIVYDAVKEVDRKVELERTGKKYRLDKGVIIETGDEGKFAKFIIDEGKITSVEFQTFNEIENGMVLDVKEDAIKYFEGTGSARTLDLEDADEIVVVRNGEIAKLHDVQDEDILFVKENSDEFFIVANSVYVEGELTKVKSDKVYVDGEKLDLSTSAYCSKDNGDNYAKITNIDDFDDLLKENVKAYTDFNGDVVYVLSSVEETSGDKYGLFVARGLDRNGDWVKVINSEGEQVIYDVDEDLTLPALIDIDLVDEDPTVTDARTAQVIKYSLNKDGLIEDLTVAGEAIANTSVVTEIDEDFIDAASKEYIEDDTVVLNLDGEKASDVEMVDWATLEEGRPSGVKAYVLDDKTTAKVIIFTEGFDNISSDDIFYGYVESKYKISSDEYELTINLGDEVKNVVFDKDKVVGIDEDDILEFKLNSKGNGILIDKKDAADAEVDVDQYVYDVDGNEILLFGASNYERVSKDVVVYDADAEEVEYADIEDVLKNKAAKIDVYRDSKGEVKVIKLQSTTSEIIATTINGAQDTLTVAAVTGVTATMGLKDAADADVVAAGTALGALDTTNHFTADGTYVLTVSYENPLDAADKTAVAYNVVVSGGNVTSVTVK